MKLLTHFAVLFFAALSLSSCGGKSDQSGEQNAAENPVNTAPAPAPSPAENKFKPWPVDSSKIVTTPSGLKYIMVQEGTGNQVKPGDNVLVHYHGMLQDGTVFDSSYDRGQPMAAPLTGLIKAWQEGIALCKVGAKIILICPPELAYGPAGQGNIPPNSTLIFDVEVLGIN